jgi:hypothetical protein
MSRLPAGKIVSGPSNLWRYCPPVLDNLKRVGTKVFPSPWAQTPAKTRFKLVFPFDAFANDSERSSYIELLCCFRACIHTADPNTDQVETGYTCHIPPPGWALFQKAGQQSTDDVRIRTLLPPTFNLLRLPHHSRGGVKIVVPSIPLRSALSAEVFK